MFLFEKIFSSSYFRWANFSVISRFKRNWLRFNTIYKFNSIVANSIYDNTFINHVSNFS